MNSILYQKLVGTSRKCFVVGIYFWSYESLFLFYENHIENQILMSVYLQLFYMLKFDMY
jgi:hypothetical protein